MYPNLAYVAYSQSQSDMIEQFFMAHKQNPMTPSSMAFGGSYNIEKKMNMPGT